MQTNPDAADCVQRLRRRIDDLRLGGPGDAYPEAIWVRRIKGTTQVLIQNQLGQEWTGECEDALARIAHLAPDPEGEAKGHERLWSELRGG